ncbi:MAG: Hsp70 family protein [Lachnospiraceae bacterium]|nr:Hsp70 family protein [Lachnospiraceae bacterium]
MMIGIDLGTTNSLVCVYRNGKTELIPNALGEYMTKSAVSVLEDGTILTGTAAKERLISHPDQTAASFKRFMGTEKTYTLGDKTFLPHELSALILKQLYDDAKRYLGEEIDEAVISVPAYFDDNQRNATKLAAQLAGLPVKRLINEPSAAALYHNLHTSVQDCRLMLIDFGGGTLDVSIVECFENVIEIIAIAGDNQLGGDDIDKAIAEHFCKIHSLKLSELSKHHQAALFRQAEAAKKALSEGSVPVIRMIMQETYELELNKSLLRALCQPYLNRMKSVIARAVHDSHLSPPELDDIILAGGSAKLAVLGDFLEELTGRRPYVSMRSEYMVAEGTGICAGIKERREELQDIVMTDVCPFSLGIAVANDVRDQNLHMAVLIQRSSMLPTSRTETFYTLYDNQTHIRLQIFQGEGYYASENLKLGELMVRVPRGRAGQHYVKVCFAYDINGILHVDAESSGGDFQDTVIVNPSVQLDEAELLEKVEMLKHLRFIEEGSEEDHLLMAKMERLYEELIGSEREQVAELLAGYQKVLQCRDQIELRKLRKFAKVQTQNWEQMLSADPWQV